MGKKISLLCLAFLTMAVLGGCSLVRIEEEGRKELEYTVINAEEIPREAAVLIEDRKKKEFQMTYQSDDSLYLIKGYGQQMSGGYSVAVEELSMSDTAIFFKTKLIGPSDTNQGGEPSFPYIVVKTQYWDKPVEF